MIVMGLDQHRAQVTAEWLNSATGEVSRARVAPAHRERVSERVWPLARASCLSLAGVAGKCRGHVWHGCVIRRFATAL